ncbi:site-specific integrase [Anaerobacillus alkalilacustris]|uniref:Site-specific integrase n=1 Tax=Anaerobacillus alkalilacustris TaxID=393763 RepID=A0A1S2LI21_9BACI|nr:site-specific integrase [Anaerobacillus alkalilacustris]OIJ11347.1 site-specific integrase [Anaerobacillus alkalilacustris]
MKGSFTRRGCKCLNEKKCKCGAKVTFRLDIGIDPITGRRKQISRGGFNNFKDAEAAAAQIMTELNQGTFFQESNVIFKDFVPQWLEIYSNTREVKPGTIRVRNHEIDKLIPYFANLKLRSITPELYQNALNDLKEVKGYADITVDGIHRTGRMIFKKAVELGKIRNDPTQYAYLKKDQKTIEELENEQVPKFMEKEELSLFLKTANNQGLYMDYEMFLLLSYTGIRVGEMLALKWSDINFKDRTIKITKTIYNPLNQIENYRLLTPKTKKSRREIAVEDNVIQALSNHKRSQEKNIERLGELYNDLGFVFTKIDRYYGYPLYIKHVGNRMRRLLKLAKLNEKLTPHSLRHTHTSLLAEAGVDLEKIMKRLGHSNDDTTRNIYHHLTKDMNKEASHKFGELMRSLK